jgi:hypothetical protein
MPRAIFAFGANVAGHPDNSGSLGGATGQSALK